MVSGGPSPMVLQSQSTRSHQLGFVQGPIRTLLSSQEQLERLQQLGHVPSRITSKRRVRNCVWCTRKNVYNSSGNRVQAINECLACGGVALCKARGCFFDYHRHYLQQDLQTKDASEDV